MSKPLPRSTPRLVGVLCATVGPDEALVSDHEGQAQEPTSEEGTLEASLVASQLPWPALREAATGTTVTALQFLLRGDGQVHSVDGELGPQTATAVHRLGRSLPLRPAAWARLTPMLRRASEGDAVRAPRARAGATPSVTGLGGPTTEEVARSP